MKITLDIPDDLYSELEYLVELHQKDGAPCQMESPEQTIQYVIERIADGSRRPGSWERELLILMGLNAHHPDHMNYRTHYGKTGAI